LALALRAVCGVAFAIPKRSWVQSPKKLAIAPE
jgi:hypothetical protein